MRQGLSTFDGVDETVVHGLSPGESFDETGAVGWSLAVTRVDETVHGLSLCDRRLDETGAVAGSSSSVSELKCIVSSVKFAFLYLVVGCCVLCLPRPSTTFASRCRGSGRGPRADTRTVDRSPARDRARSRPTPRWRTRFGAPGLRKEMGGHRKETDARVGARGRSTTKGLTTTTTVPC